MDATVGTRSPGPLRATLTWTRQHPYTFWTFLFVVGMAIPFFAKPDEDAEWEMVYVSGARRLLAGEELYNGKDGYLYPPFAAWCAVPFTYLAPVPCRFAWYAVNMLAVIGLCWCAWRGSGGGALEGPSASAAEQIIFWLGLACGFRYVLDGLSHQQTDVVIGAGLMAGCLALMHGRALTGATLLGLAAGVKATPLLFVVYLLWRGHWRAAVWLIAVAGGVNLLPDLIHAPPGGGLWLAQWFQQYVAPLQGSEQYVGVWGSHAIYNQSLSGAVFRLFVTDYRWTTSGFEMIEGANPLSPQGLRGLLLGIEGMIALLVAWTVGRPTATTPSLQKDSSPSRHALEFSVVFLLILLVSPMSSKPHFCTLLLPGFCLARLAVAERRYVVGGLLLAAIAVAVPSIKDLVGGQFASVALWWGAVTASTLLLLAGCAYALAVCRPGFGVSRKETDAPQPAGQRQAA